jgi:selenocysteine lyase/cysteine desulfurase
MEQTIYMNNAATSWPKPDCVVQAVAEALRQRPGSAHRGGIDDVDIFDETRKALARRMGVACYECIALGPNATWGLNMAIQGVALSAGAVVVTSTAEHNSVLRPLYNLAREQKIRLVFVEADGCGRIPVSAWAEAVAVNQPELCVFTHASNVTGAVNDAPELTRLAKAGGAIVLMDAAQTLGCIPVRAEEWGLDFVAFTGHKYLLGPQGTGGLYVRPGLSHLPVLHGGTGVQSDLEGMPEEMPLRLEAGTGNEPACYGLLAALRWAEENPLDLHGLSQMTEQLKTGLAEAGATVIAPIGECTPVVSFNIAGKTADEVGYVLSESYDIICRNGLHCAPRIFKSLGCRSSVRLSISRFTTEEEIDAAIDAVSDLAR